MYSESSIFPEAPATPQAQWLDDETLSRLGNTLYVTITASLADREILDETLDYWYSLLEMWAPPRTVPWPNSSSVFIPLVPTHFETLAAQISQQVFSQRLFLVSGNTPESAIKAHEVEHYYNTKAQQLDLIEQYEQLKNIGLRDGLGVLGVTWRRTKQRQKIAVWEDARDAAGTKVIDLRARKPKRTRKMYDVDVTAYDNVQMTPIEARDFGIIPSWQTDINEAHAVWWKVYLDEIMLRQGVNNGYFIKEECERALRFVTAGTSERSYDQQGVQTVTLGGKIEVGAEEGVTDFSLGQMRGPLEIMEIHSRQFTFKTDEFGNEIPIEYVFWLHLQSQRVIGYKAYEYFLPERPFVTFAPLPRPRRVFGWSLIERLAPMQAEVNNLWNGRNDVVELITRPPLYQRAGAKIITPNGKGWSPGVMWEVSAPDDVGFIGGPAGRAIDLSSSVEQEDRLLNFANLVTGATSNMQGSVNSGRRTAREVNASNSFASIRVGYIAQRLRTAIRKSFWMWHMLQQQYGPDEETVSVRVLGMPQPLTIDKATLSLDYTLDVAGSSGQLDQQLRAEQALQMYLLLKDDPDIAGDAIKRYKLKLMLFDAYNRTDTVAILGTDQEAMQRQQSEQEAKMKDQQMRETMIQMGINPDEHGGRGGSAHQIKLPSGPPPVP